MNISIEKSSLAKMNQGDRFRFGWSAKRPRFVKVSDSFLTHLSLVEQNQRIFYDWAISEFSEPALPRQSILGLGRLGREADLRVTSTNLLFGFFENLSQNSILY